VVWLGVKHTGIPVPQIAYGYTLQKVGDLEKKINSTRRSWSPQIFTERAAAGKAALAAPDKSFAEGKAKLEQELAD